MYDYMSHCLYLFISMETEEMALKEDIEVHKNRKQEVENTFGDAPLPQLQRVTFDVSEFRVCVHVLRVRVRVHVRVRACARACTYPPHFFHLHLSTKALCCFHQAPARNRPLPHPYQQHPHHTSK